MMCPHSKTVDGFEMQLGVNHLGESDGKLQASARDFSFDSLSLGCDISPCSGFFIHQYMRSEPMENTCTFGRTLFPHAYTEASVEQFGPVAATQRVGSCQTLCRAKKDLRPPRRPLWSSSMASRSSLERTVTLKTPSSASFASAKKADWLRNPLNFFNSFYWKLARQGQYWLSSCFIFATKC